MKAMHETSGIDVLSPSQSMPLQERDLRLHDAMLEPAAGSTGRVLVPNRLQQPSLQRAACERGMRMHSATRTSVSRIVDREARDGTGTDEIIGASVALRRVLRDV